MRLIAALLLGTILTGCHSAGPIYEPPKLSDRDKLVVSDRFAVTYMARGMLPGQLRDPYYIKATTGQAYVQNASQASGPGAGGAVAGAVGAGVRGQNLLSQSGGATAIGISEGLGAVGAVVGLIEGDGSHPNIGGIDLPGVVDGVSLSSPGQARDYARKFAVQKLAAAADQLGRDMVCFDQCDSFYPTFELRKRGGSMVSDTDPQSVYVSLLIHPLRNAAEIKDIGAMSEALKFIPAWHGVFYLCLNDENPGTSHTTVDGERFPGYDCRSTYNHRVDRVVMRSETQGKYFSVGLYGKRIFAFDGRVFSLGSNKNPGSLVDYEISPVADSL